MTDLQTRLPSFATVRRTAHPTGFAPAFAGVTLEAVTLVIGLACLLLAWLPGPPFRLEQFDLPKDIALGVVGCLSALLLLERRVPWQSALDVPLAASLAWGAILTLTVATNSALGWHVVGLFCASALLFMAARRVGANHGTRFAFCVISALVFALLVLVLLEGFGGIPLMSSPGRRPGATLGNRNRL